LKTAFVDPGPSTSGSYGKIPAFKSSKSVRKDIIDDGLVAQLSQEVSDSPSVDDIDSPDYESESENDATSGKLAQYLLADDENSPENEYDSDDIGGIPVLGNKPQYSWEPPKKAFSWYKKVADTDLTEDQVDEFMANFIPPTDVQCHFDPPKLPKIIWNKINSGTEESYRQRSIVRSQKLLSSAMMPLLTVLDSLKSEDPHKEILASAMQMLCTSNLQLTKVRRSAIGRFVKSDMKQPLFAQPVSHLHMFGTDFDSSADIAAKNQSAFQKVLYVPKKRTTTFQSPIVQQQQPSGRGEASSSYSSSRPERTQTSRPASSRSSVTRNDGRSERQYTAQDPPPRQPFRGSRGRGRYPRRARGGRWSY
jgi:hypothetical protein